MHTSSEAQGERSLNRCRIKALGGTASKSFDVCLCGHLLVLRPINWELESFDNG